MRSGIDGAHSTYYTATLLELPVHEHPQADEPLVVESEPHRRAPERIVAMFPVKERLVERVALPAKTVAEEREDERQVRVETTANLHRWVQAHEHATLR